MPPDRFTDMSDLQRGNTVMLVSVQHATALKTRWNGMPLNLAYDDAKNDHHKGSKCRTSLSVL